MLGRTTIGMDHVGMVRQARYCVKLLSMLELSQMIKPWATPVKTESPAVKQSAMLSWQTPFWILVIIQMEKNMGRLQKESLWVFPDPACKNYHIQNLCLCETQTELLCYPRLNSYHYIYLLLLSLSNAESLGIETMSYLLILIFKYVEVPVLCYKYSTTFLFALFKEQIGNIFAVPKVNSWSPFSNILWYGL